MLGYHPSNHDASRSSFRESAKQALKASKQVDGTLRIHTPFQDQQTQKVANLKQQLTKLSSASNYMRCQSGLDSSTNSVTAATSYAGAALYGSGIMNTGTYHNRPNSNVSNLIEAGRNTQGYKAHYGTELTRFSQNSYSKDLSPLRASNLAHPEGTQGHQRQYSRGNLKESKQTFASSAVQNSRKNGGRLSDFSPVYESHSAVPRNRKFENEVYQTRNPALRGRQRGGSQGSLYRSASHKTRSMGSLRSNQSSPERLVNIVCPPSKSQRNKHRSRVAKADKNARPRSDMRQKIYNSFGQNYDNQTKKKYISQKMKAFANSQGFLYGSFQSNKLGSSQRLCLANLTKNRQISTPLKSRKSATSLSQTRSKSRSCSRIGANQERNSHNGSALKFSSKRSSKKLKQHAILSKWVKSGSKNRLNMRSGSRTSVRSKSGCSTARSNNSNRYGGLSSGGMKRDSRRAEKYSKNQGNGAVLKKQFTFESIHADKRVLQDQKAHSGSHTRQASGQVTGKFRSLNEQTFNHLMTKSKNIGQKKYQQQVAFAAGSLKTEDDLCDTLTASSEESPMRPAQRVQRAAQLTTKAYLNEVTHRVEQAAHAGHLSIKEFGSKKLKAAYQGINERQGARLQCLKQQMKDSLVETHSLQAKLQHSSDIRDANVKRGQVSQFNSLVLEFSSNLENMATEMIEATESKRRELRMKEMLGEMEQMRRARSRSGSKSCPASARGRKSPRSGSKKKKLSRKSTPRSARSKSSAKKLKKKTGRKRSKSASKTLKRSKSKSKSVKRKRSASRLSARSVASSVSRGRSRSRKKMKSIKRNIFKHTNGFRDSSKSSFGVTKSKAARSNSKSRRGRSKSRSKSVSKMRSLSSKAFSRAKELAKKCEKLVNTRFNVVSKSNTKVPKSRKRSMSKNSKMSRSKSRGKKMKARSKSAKKLGRKDSKSPARFDQTVTPTMQYSKLQQQQQMTPCMTPLHKILRNSMGDPEMSEMRSNMRQLGSTMKNKKVKICSRRLQDITQMSSSDSDSSADSEDSYSHERYMKRQQAQLSPWQRACIRKQLPKKFR